MPFGDIFVGTFRLIWRHKKLWLFGLLAALLSGVGLGLYQLFGLRWQNDAMQTMSRIIPNGAFDWPRRFGFEVMSSLSGLWIVMSLLILFSVLGYIISLVMRGAIMHEAAIAWGGGSTDTSRGISAGVGRAAHVFLLDLLWSLLPFLIVCGVIVSMVGVILTAITLGGNEGFGGFIALLFILFLCSVVCVALLLAIVVGILPPLMYQSAVGGRRSVGEAVAEGWRLTRDNLGAMIIFWLLLILLSVVLNAIIQAVTLPLTLPWMGTWMTDWSAAMDNFMRDGQLNLPPLRVGWLVISGLVSVVLSLLVNSFLLTFRHTLYAEVYRRLTGTATSVESAPEFAPDEEPAVG